MSVQVSTQDTTAIFCLMHVNTNRAFYQADMINFVHWGDTNHLIINTSKTEELTLGPNTVGEHSLIVIYNTHIKQLCSYKHLGFHTDNMLTWQVHGDILCAKLQ